MVIETGSDPMTDLHGLLVDLGARRLTVPRNL